MAVRLIQLRNQRGGRIVAAARDGEAFRLDGAQSVLGLASKAIERDATLAALVAELATDEQVDLDAAEAEGRLLPAIDHPDPARLHLTGTGLTHLGSAEGRDKMHKQAAAGAVTDSMRMFLMGLEQGKPESGAGCQPEWFFKGDGSSLVGPGDDLRSPDFALDGSEEPEIAGIYLIDAQGQPRRLGFALANEFSDHVTERHNYLWLAHSKLRPAALGAEILTGELPADVRGTSRIVRDGETLWESPFLSGEANMSHWIANLEHHHFKYGLFRRPGDVHVHFFGTATLSFAQSVKTEPGDIFEIEADPFALKLRNRLAVAEPSDVRVTPL
ncbi:FAH family protein [Sphingomonas sp. SM33]|uniref:FAH family protein n=1 Tax=Sphingomonas telluris TaxID=2907998 RepID=A0ABS9VI37_9SPHN|nr:AraD1 family protein [Sphingomonas telluris]MCH8614638.1 FAH family protein [Sphingomonas telluris]